MLRAREDLRRTRNVEHHGYFSEELFRFLEELREHNSREWFQRNKQRYESAVRDPFIQFIADLAGPLKKINRYMVVDPRPAGGSMMRIHRDIRFSRDKACTKHLSLPTSGIRR